MVGITVGIDYGYDRDVQLRSFLNRDGLSVRVDHKQSIGQPIHVSDPTQILLELLALALKASNFFLRQLFIEAISPFFFQIFVALDAVSNCYEVRKQPTQPAIVYVVHPTALSLFRDRFLSLPLGSNKQDGLPSRRDIGQELYRLLEKSECCLEIYDVDSVSLTKDVGFHLRVPAAGLVPKMNTRF